MVDASSPLGGDEEDLEEKSSMSETPALLIRLRLRAIVVALHSVKKVGHTDHKQSVMVSSSSVVFCLVCRGFSIHLRLRKRKREKSYVITKRKWRE